MRSSKWQTGDFRAWDGEGITFGKARASRHEYVVFAGSDGTKLVDPNGLHTRDVLNALCDGFASAPRAIHVGFAISYDVNMIVRDLPDMCLRELWDTERTRVRFGREVFVLHWRPRKFFRVHRERSGEPREGGTWWDVWPFFQSSFVRALTTYKVAPDLVNELARMKARRAIFTVKELPAIIDYNTWELRALVELMDALRASLDAAGLPVSRWDGPGAIAAALLTRYDFKHKISAPVPEDALDAFQYAYYGGRIECVQYGHHQQHGRPIHHYDVNSAYPAAMQALPCRSSGCGSWKYVASRKRTGAQFGSSAFAVHRVRWRWDSQVLYPFPWRSAKGSVYFPRYGDGWVWTPELLAARTHARGALEVVESWIWQSRCKHKEPATRWIADIYAERLRAKARGDAAEHAIKLGINSLYGKLAQRIGAQWFGGAWRTPPFHDLAGAGWVTSTVRAQLYTAAMQHPRDVVMLATDGLYSTRAHRVKVSPPEAKALGEWSYAQHPSATVVQSGVYIVTDPDGSESIYSRGFDADSVDRAAILRGWRARAPHLSAHHERFIGLGAALASPKRFELWRRWVKEPRILALTPWGTKREPPIDKHRRAPDASRGLVLTHATDTRRFWGDMIGGSGSMTTPSPVPWRDLAPGAEDFSAWDKLDIEADDATL